MAALGWVSWDPVQGERVSTGPTAGAVATALPKSGDQKLVAFPWVQLSPQVPVLQVCVTQET